MASPALPLPTIPPITPPPTTLESVLHLDSTLTFPSFTSATAWTLGSLLRQRLLQFPNPCCINISLAQGNHLLFHAVTHSGTTPDNDSWVARKRKAVLRWGVSTYALHLKYGGDEAVFAAKHALGPEERGEYAIHGGGWPVRVRGVEGVVAVVVVSGLKQELDHGVILEVVGEMLEGMGAGGAGGGAEGEKKKED
nr:hypothetical protein B0A51_16821 [Rachicladosporium sp. CCFEE 5018]